MWNLLGNDYRHYITAHKNAEITWNDHEIGSNISNPNNDINKNKICIDIL